MGKIDFKQVTRKWLCNYNRDKHYKKRKTMACSKTMKLGDLPILEVYPRQSRRRR